jgi:hypothetical protein
MSRKSNYRVERLWQQLRDLVTPIENDKTYELLDVVRCWIKENEKNLGFDFTKDRAALSLLLEGKASQFPINRPIEAGQYMKSLILTPPIPRNLETMADTLEAAIREFAIFTEWQDCPVCQEGYLGYWIEPRTKTLVLCCPECWWRQELSGKEWLDSSPLLPASIQELSM